MEEVPDSTWFQRRIGAGLTPEDIARGPGTGVGPAMDQPWRVVGVKPTGISVGFIVRDSRGDRYIVKFDRRGHPETETSTDVVVQRLLYAFGYNVPENHVVFFTADQLEIGEDSTIDDGSGERALSESDLEMFLSLVATEDGRYRALVSRFIDGEIIGGIVPEGTRDGDPNDTVPHELRRELRGARVPFAWLNHADVKPRNTLVVKTEEGYLRRYLIDFGMALGQWSHIHRHRRYVGHYGYWDLGWRLRSLVSLGLWVRPWERDQVPPYRGLGALTAQVDLDRWSQHQPWRPLEVADRFDLYWGAKVLLGFTRAHVQAAVAAGRFSDPRTERYLVDTLMARRRTIVRQALARVAPLESWEVRSVATNATLCFRDLWIAHGFAGSEPARYVARTFDFAGALLGAGKAAVADPQGRACLGDLPTGVAEDGYTIVEIRGRRGDRAVPPVFVHLARAPSGVLRVIGLDRR